MLSSSEKYIFTTAAIILPFVELRIRKYGLKPYAAALQSTSSGSQFTKQSRTKDNVDDILKKSILIGQAARCSPIHVRCLAKSIYLHGLLLREGIMSVVIIGVETPDSGFNAHAWLEVNGSVINDSDDCISNFTRIELSGEHLARLAKSANF